MTIAVESAAATIREPGVEFVGAEGLEPPTSAL